MTTNQRYQDINESIEVEKMREVTDHKIEGVDNLLSIQVLDEPGAGGACHHYAIYGSDSVYCQPEQNCLGIRQEIHFQKGPVKEAGLNGVTNETLMGICIDRLRSFQAGEYACYENRLALFHLERALGYLQKRTLERLARGVEGTNVR